MDWRRPIPLLQTSGDQEVMCSRRREQRWCHMLVIGNRNPCLSILNLEHSRTYKIKFRLCGHGLSWAFHSHLVHINCWHSLYTAFPESLTVLFSMCNEFAQFQTEKSGTMSTHCKGQSEEVRSMAYRVGIMVYDNSGMISHRQLTYMHHEMILVQGERCEAQYPVNQPPTWTNMCEQDTNISL